MPALESSYRRQTAVLWEVYAVDKFNEPLRDTPVEIDVRWNTRQSEAADAQGNRVVLDATAVVGRAIPVGSLMWLGELADFVGTGTGSSGDDTEIMEVMTYSETPDLKARNVRREVGLAYFRDTMPALRT